MVLNTDHPQATLQLPTDDTSPRARKGTALLLSIIFHALLLILYFCCKNTSHSPEVQSGKAGSPVTFIVYNAPSPSLAEARTSSEVIPLPNVRQAVIAVEHKELSSKHKRVKKVVVKEKNKSRSLANKKVNSLQVNKKQATSIGKDHDEHIVEKSHIASAISDQGELSTKTGESTAVHMHILNRRVNYPSRARAMGVEGWVKAQFDISESGTLKNIRILAEDPPGVFGEDLRRDISRWRYDTNGEIKNQVVTVIFKIDGHIQVVN